MGGGDNYQEHAESSGFAQITENGDGKGKGKAKGKGRKNSAKSNKSGGKEEEDCLSLDTVGYLACPKGRSKALMWVPIGIDSMNDRMRETRVHKVREKSDPAWVVSINLLDRDSREYADINVWPGLDRECRKRSGMHFSEYLVDNERTGMVVNRGHWETWTPKFFDNTLDMLRFSKEMAARTDMAGNQDLVDLICSKTREQEEMLLKKQEEDDAERRARNAEKWKKFGHERPAADREGYLVGLMRHKALVAAYLEERFTSSEEYERLAADRRKLQPHVPTTMAGEARQMLTRWCMSSLLQQSIPLMRKELTPVLNSTDCSEITRITFNPAAEV